MAAAAYLSFSLYLFILSHISQPKDGHSVPIFSTFWLFLTFFTVPYLRLLKHLVVVSTNFQTIIDGAPVFGICFIVQSSAHLLFLRKVLDEPLLESLLRPDEKERKKERNMIIWVILIHNLRGRRRIKISR